MPVLLVQDRHIIAKSSNREKIIKFLEKKYPGSKVMMARDPHDKAVFRVHVNSGQVMRQFDLYNTTNWRLWSDRKKHE